MGRRALQAIAVDAEPRLVAASRRRCRTGWSKRARPADVDERPAPFLAAAALRPAWCRAAFLSLMRACLGQRGAPTQTRSLAPSGCPSGRSGRQARGRPTGSFGVAAGPAPRCQRDRRLGGSRGRVRLRAQPRRCIVRRHCVSALAAFASAAFAGAPCIVLAGRRRAPRAARPRLQGISMLHWSPPVSRRSLERGRVVAVLGMAAAKSDQAEQAEQADRVPHDSRCCP